MDIYSFSGYSGYVDEHGQPVRKTKQEWPYSYDGFVVHRMGPNSEANSTIYSDRLSQWDYQKTNELKVKHFGDKSDYWSGRKPTDIENFLRDYTGDSKLKLVLVMEYCNVSSGYPLWRFDVSKNNEE